MAAEWHYGQGEEQHGPVPLEELQQLVASGQVQPTDMVWNEDMPDWLPAGEVEELFPKPETASEPAAEEPPSVPPEQPADVVPSPRGKRLSFRTTVIGIAAFCVVGIVVAGSLIFFGGRQMAADKGTTSVQVGKQDDGGKGASTAALTVDGKSVLDDSMAFVGVWECGDVVITLNDDFTFHKNVGKQRGGTWKYVNGEAHIFSDDGKQTILRRDGQGFRKLTWLAGVSMDSPPSNSFPAVKKSGAAGGNTGGQESSAKGQVVDLLKLIDPSRDTLRGTWKLEGATLTCDSASALVIPCSLPEEYSLTIVAERGTGKGCFAVGLIVGASPCMVRIDSIVTREYTSGISQIDGQKPEDNESTYHGQVLQQGAAHTIECAVRKAGQERATVTVTVDGKKVIDWTGAISRLSLPLRNPLLNSHPWLESFKSSFSISKLELRPIGATPNVGK